MNIKHLLLVFSCCATRKHKFSSLTQCLLIISWFHGYKSRAGSVEFSSGPNQGAGQLRNHPGALERSPLPSAFCLLAKFSFVVATVSRGHSLPLEAVCIPSTGSSIFKTQQHQESPVGFESNFLSAISGGISLLLRAYVIRLSPPG